MTANLRTRLLQWVNRLAPYPWNAVLLGLATIYRRKRQKADISTTPTGMLEYSALVAAGCAPGASSELVARDVRSPADDRHGAGDRRRVRTLLAVEPEPGRGAGRRASWWYAGTSWAGLDAR
jgi:hypothetical protein